MVDVARLQIEIDSSGVVKADDRLDRMNKTARTSEKRTSALGAAWKSFGSVLTVGAVAMGFRSILRATARAQESQAQLAAGLASTGGVSGQTMASLQALADELQRTTVFGDEVVEAAEAILLSFTNIADDAFPRTVKAAADVAVRMGVDLRSAVVQLGKALNEPVQNLGALSRAGIQFSKDQKELIRNLWETGRTAEAQRIILAELERQYGGSAQAARDTLGGAIQALTNSWGDFKEAIGIGLAPALTPIFNMLSSFFTSMDTWINTAAFAWLKAWAEIKFGTLEVLAVLKGTWATTVGAFRDVWNTVLSGMQAALAAFLNTTADALQSIETGANALGKTFVLIATNIRGAALMAAEASAEYKRMVGASTAAVEEMDQTITTLEEERMAAVHHLTVAQADATAEQMRFRVEAVQAADDIVKAQAHVTEQTKDLGEWTAETATKARTLADDMRQAWSNWSGGVVDALFDAERRSKLTFESIATDFARMIAKMMARRALARLPGIGASLIRGGGFQTTGFAQGGIIDRPTVFPMANGLGLAGEGGRQEAILPLSRTASGDLGVRAVDGARTTVTIINNTGAEVREERRRTRQGEDVRIVIGRMVNEHLSRGGADGVLLGEFGISRLGRR